MLRSAILVLTLASTALIAGCSSEPPVEVPASEIAATAAGALEQSTGELPEMDCGDDSIPLKNGTKLDCVLTDTTLGEDFDSRVTLSDVNGANYSVSVEVSEEPRE
ncbi:DUF4333 domain-containing protein [Salinibacterium sp. NG22]|uniref:DUF4333 domain-containing protein n=1 Tax=Salinibacterium sp. NG22 TaxID=2792040 RepID=UPI0018CEFD3B|nr:DUF4333 domain-containing protein [Salinibacterium sp. NG22]MBH0111272.1 DUF4333 domain-containing protein [Salinibacterium sp. NG22]